MESKKIAEEETLFTSSHPEIEKRLIVKTALLSSVYAEAGLVILIMALVLGKEYQTWSMLGLVVGVLLVAVGCYRVFCCSRREVYLPTGSLVRQKVLFFDLKHEAALRHCVETGDFNLAEPVESVSNGCVKLEALCSDDGQFVGVQLFEFVPYAYSPVSPVRYYKDEQAIAFSKFVKSIKMKRT